MILFAIPTYFPVRELPAIRDLSALKRSLHVLFFCESDAQSSAKGWRFSPFQRGHS